MERDVTDMDRGKKTNHNEGQLARKYSRASSSKGRCLIPVKRKPQRGITKTLDDGRENVDSARVVELNLKASLMGVKIYGDKDHFFSRQSSMSSSRLSGKFRAGVAIPCCSGGVQGRHSVEKKQHRGISIVASSNKPHTSRLDMLLAASPERSKAVSGVLYPSPQVGNNANSSILNAVHFTFGDASIDGCEKIYKQLLEQSKICSDDGKLETQTLTSELETKQSHQILTSDAAKAEKYSDAVSTLFCETDRYPRASCSSSLTFSERLFGYEFSRDSPQRPAKGAAKPEPQPGQTSMSIPAMSDFDDTDDDDIILEDDIVLEDDIIFEVPSGIPLHCSHYAELVKVGAKPRPKCERWSSNKQSFNLELDQQPIKGLSINVNREPGRAKLDVSLRDMSSLNSSFKGGGALSSFRSDRSGWLEFESDLNDFVLDSGRLKIDVKYDPPDDGAKIDEEDFPFNSPVASTFVFGDGLKKDAQQQNSSLSSQPRTVIVETDDDLDHSDAYHDPEDGSISDTDSSLTTFSLEADSTSVLESQPSHWVSTRSFNYLREVVDHNSGFLDIESRSGRFSVDLRQEKRLGRVDHHPARPGMRLCMKTEKPSSRRSLLSPCLRFLHRQRKLSRLQQISPMAASGRLSCTGLVAKVTPKVQSYDSFTARLGHAAGADSPSGLQVMNCFTCRLGQTAETAPQLQAYDSFTARLGP